MFRPAIGVLIIVLPSVVNLPPGGMASLRTLFVGLVVLQLTSLTKAINCELLTQDWHEVPGKCTGIGVTSDGPMVCGPFGLWPNIPFCLGFTSNGAFKNLACAKKLCEQEHRCGGLLWKGSEGKMYPMGWNLGPPAGCGEGTRTAEDNCEGPQCVWDTVNSVCSYSTSYYDDPCLTDCSCHLMLQTPETFGSCNAGSLLLGGHCVCDPDTTFCGDTGECMQLSDSQVGRKYSVLQSAGVRNNPIKVRPVLRLGNRKAMLHPINFAARRISIRNELSPQVNSSNSTSHTSALTSKLRVSVVKVAPQGDPKQREERRNATVAAKLKRALQVTILQDAVLPDAVREPYSVAAEGSKFSNTSKEMNQKLSQAEGISDLPKEQLKEQTAEDPSASRDVGALSRLIAELIHENEFEVRDIDELALAPADAPSEDAPPIAVVSITRTPMDAPQEVPEDAPEEAPKDAPEEAPVDPPEDAPEDPPEEAPEDPPEDAPEDPPEEAPEDAPEEAPEDPPEEAPEDAPEEAPEDPPAEAPEDAPEEAPEDPPEEAPEDAPEEAPEDPPEEAPEDAPEEAPEDAPEEAPEDPPEEAPEDVPEEAPEDPPEEAPEDVPEEAPEDAPEEAAPEEAPEDAPEEAAPEEAPEDAPEEAAPEEAPEDPPEEAPEDVPEEAPEDAPEEAAPEEAPEDAPEEAAPEEAPEDAPEEVAPGEAPEDAPEDEPPSDAPDNGIPEDAPNDSPNESPYDGADDCSGDPCDSNQFCEDTDGELNSEFTCICSWPLYGESTGSAAYCRDVCPSSLPFAVDISDATLGATITCCNTTDCTEAGAFTGNDYIDYVCFDDPSPSGCSSDPSCGYYPEECPIMCGSCGDDCDWNPCYDHSCIDDDGEVNSRFTCHCKSPFWGDVYVDTVAQCRLMCPATEPFAESLDGTTTTCCATEGCTTAGTLEGSYYSYDCRDNTYPSYCTASNACIDYPDDCRVQCDLCLDDCERDPCNGFTCTDADGNLDSVFKCYCEYPYWGNVGESAAADCTLMCPGATPFAIDIGGSITCCATQDCTVEGSLVGNYIEYECIDNNFPDTCTATNACTDYPERCPLTCGICSTDCERDPCNGFTCTDADGNLDSVFKCYCEYPYWGNVGESAAADCTLMCPGATPFAINIGGSITCCATQDCTVEGSLVGNYIEYECIDNNFPDTCTATNACTDYPEKCPLTCDICSTDCERDPCNGSTCTDADGNLDSVFKCYCEYPYWGNVGESAAADCTLMCPGATPFAINIGGSITCCATQDCTVEGSLVGNYIEYECIDNNFPDICTATNACTDYPEKCPLTCDKCSTDCDRDPCDGHDCVDDDGNLNSIFKCYCSYPLRGSSDNEIPVCNEMCPSTQPFAVDVGGIISCCTESNCVTVGTLTGSYISYECLDNILPDRCTATIACTDYPDECPDTCSRCATDCDRSPCGDDRCEDYDEILNSNYDCYCLHPKWGEAHNAIATCKDMCPSTSPFAVNVGGLITCCTKQDCTELSDLSGEYISYECLDDIKPDYCTTTTACSDFKDSCPATCDICADDCDRSPCGEHRCEDLDGELNSNYNCYCNYPLWGTSENSDLVCNSMCPSTEPFAVDIVGTITCCSTEDCTVHGTHSGLYISYECSDNIYPGKCSDVNACTDYPDECPLTCDKCADDCDRSPCDSNRCVDDDGSLDMNFICHCLWPTWGSHQGGNVNICYEMCPAEEPYAIQIDPETIACCQFTDCTTGTIRGNYITYECLDDVEPDICSSSTACDDNEINCPFTCGGCFDDCDSNPCSHDGSQECIDDGLFDGVFICHCSYPYFGESVDNQAAVCHEMCPSSTPYAFQLSDGGTTCCNRQDCLPGVEDSDIKTYNSILMDFECIDHQYECLFAAQSDTSAYCGDTENYAKCSFSCECPDDCELYPCGFEQQCTDNDGIFNGAYTCSCVYPQFGEDGSSQLGDCNYLCPGTYPLVEQLGDETRCCKQHQPDPNNDCVTQDELNYQDYLCIDDPAFDCQNVDCTIDGDHCPQACSSCNNDCDHSPCGDQICIDDDDELNFEYFCYCTYPLYGETAVNSNIEDCKHVCPPAFPFAVDINGETTCCSSMECTGQGPRGNYVSYICFDNPEPSICSDSLIACSEYPEICAVTCDQCHSDCIVDPCGDTSVQSCFDNDGQINSEYTCKCIYPYWGSDSFAQKAECLQMCEVDIPYASTYNPDQDTTACCNSQDCLPGNEGKDIQTYSGEYISYDCYDHPISCEVALSDSQVTYCEDATNYLKCPSTCGCGNDCVTEPCGLEQTCSDSGTDKDDSFECACIFPSVGDTTQSVKAECSGICPELQPWATYDAGNDVTNCCFLKTCEIVYSESDVSQYPGKLESWRCVDNPEVCSDPNSINCDEGVCRFACDSCPNDCDLNPCGDSSIHLCTDEGGLDGVFTCECIYPFTGDTVENGPNDCIKMCLLSTPFAVKGEFSSLCCDNPSCSGVYKEHVADTTSYFCSDLTYCADVNPCPSAASDCPLMCDECPNDCSVGTLCPEECSDDDGLVNYEGFHCLCPSVGVEDPPENGCSSRDTLANIDDLNSYCGLCPIACGLCPGDCEGRSVCPGGMLLFFRDVVVRSYPKITKNNK